jgi:predicted nucleotidyltransferase
LGYAAEGLPYNGSVEERAVDRYRRILRQHLPELSEKYHVRTLEVFGSYVRDEQTPDSDLDVLVTFEKAPDLFQYIELEDHLGEILGIKVDLVMKSALKPRLEQRILHEAVPV